MPPTLSAHARRLAVVLEVLALLALVSGFFPIALSSPIWWLRLGDSLVNLAPVLLLAVILLRFASLSLNVDDEDDWLALGRQTVQLASRWGLVFALLVPLQLISFGWLWFDSADKLSAQLNQATTELAGLRNRLNAAGSEAELQRLQASTIPGLLPPLIPGSLAQQKTQLTEALDQSRSSLQANLNRQRTGVTAILFTIRRHFQ